jgi:hypothetical protein
MPILLQLSWQFQHSQARRGLFPAVSVIIGYFTAVAGKIGGQKARNLGIFDP